LNSVPQPVPVTLAPAQQDAGGNHSGNATGHQDRTGDANRSDPIWGGAGFKGGSTPQTQLHCCWHPHPKPGKESENGHANSDARSLHTKLHLLERVTVGCPWRPWHNVNTSIV
jgi:hypothetical protein